MKKYSLLGIAVLVLLRIADCYTPNHRNHRLYRRATHPDATSVQSCLKATQTSTVTMYMDQIESTMGIETQSATGSLAMDHHEPAVSSSSTKDMQTSVAPPPPSHSNDWISSLVNSLPISELRAPPSASSSPICSSPSISTSRIVQSNRHIPPQSTALSQLPNPLDPDFVPEISNSFLGQDQYGISYSPYKADSTCKNQAEVNQDIQQLRQFSFVRFYGVDCDQAQTITNAVRGNGNGMMVFAGLFDIDNIEGDLQKIIDVADGDWSTFYTVSIGNELVNRGKRSPAEVVGAVSSARNILRAAGYQGPVVTVDTFNQMISHPELCDESDYCAANCHAFFDPNQTPENAGPYVLEQSRQVSEASASNKTVIITESGWPTAGDPNGKAVPSPYNQMVALKSLRQSFPDGGIVFFSAFDDKWKSDSAWTFGTEKNWGLLNLNEGAGQFPDFINSS